MAQAFKVHDYACSLGVPNRRWNLWRHNCQAPNVTFPHTYCMPPTACCKFDHGL